MQQKKNPLSGMSCAATVKSTAPSRTNDLKDLSVASVSEIPDFFVVKHSNSSLKAGKYFLTQHLINLNIE